MTYATVADLRDEGVRESEASDARLGLLLKEATAHIDRVTGWFFEPRAGTYRLDGRCTPSVELPVPPIRIDRLTIGDSDVSLDPERVVVVGAPVQPGFDGPRITFRYGRFPRGRGNVVVEGLWGFTEYDGTEIGCVPFAIRRACMMLVLRNLTPLADEASFEMRNRARITSERTKDQGYTLSAIAPGAAALTGDPEVDSLLLPYVRPRPIGAA